MKAKLSLQLVDREGNLITEPTIGMMGFDVPNDKVYVYSEDAWQQCKMNMPDGLKLNMYDINKQVVAQLPCLTIEELEKKAKALITEYQNEQIASYYMMLCNDLKYYTLFHIDEFDGGSQLSFLPNEVLSCLISFTDDIKEIDFTEDRSAIEIWFSKNEETYVMYLFNYDAGVIECA